MKRSGLALCDYCPHLVTHFFKKVRAFAGWKLVRNAASAGGFVSPVRESQAAQYYMVKGSSYKTTFGDLKWFSRSSLTAQVKCRSPAPAEQERWAALVMAVR